MISSIKARFSISVHIENYLLLVRKCQAQHPCCAAAVCSSMMDCFELLPKKHWVWIHLTRWTFIQWPCWWWAGLPLWELITELTQAVAAPTAFCAHPWSSAETQGNFHVGNSSPCVTACLKQLCRKTWPYPSQEEFMKGYLQSKANILSTLLKKRKYKASTS